MSRRSTGWFGRQPATSYPEGAVVGPARADRRTKNLIPRLQPGDIAVIDHDDIDRVAGEGLVQAGVVAVINAAPSITGRYPNLGPRVIADAGIPILEKVDPSTLDLIEEGAEAALIDDQLLVDGEVVATGERLRGAQIDELLVEARSAVSEELERFAENTLGYLRREAQQFTTAKRLPDIGIDFRGRHVLLVVRGSDYREDLEALRRIGYMTELRPILVAVDGGADAMLELGLKPDLIVGDFDSVSRDALSVGSRLVVHAYPGGEAPGAARLDRLGHDYTVLEAPGTSEDAAMELAWEGEAELIVAVGTHSSMAEFLDKGREGMASTFLTRMKVGPILVDAKGVSRLYKSSVRKGDLFLLVASAIFTIVVIVIVSEPIRLVLRTLWLGLQ